MKTYLFAFLTLLISLFTLNAVAFTPPPAPANGWYVVDQAGKLTTAALANINHRIEAVNQITKNELGVLVIPSMNGDVISDVANSTYRAWGIGKRGLDNGVLLVISVAERKWRIETGKGIEGEITDLQANDVARQHLVPYLRRGDYAGGIMETINSLDLLMESRVNQKTTSAPAATVNTPAVADTSTPSAVSTNDHSGLGIFIGIVLAVLLIGGGFWVYSAYQSSQEEERQRRLRASRARHPITPEVPHEHVVPHTSTHSSFQTYSYEETAPNVQTYVPSVSYTAPTSNNDLFVAAALTSAFEDAAEQRRLEREAREEREAERRELAREREREADERRREREEEVERRSSRDDDDSSSDWSSNDNSPSWDSGSSDSDSGSGFGGGSSDGGGSDGSW